MSKTASALTAATTPLAGTEELYVVQGGNSRRTTASAFYIPGGTDVAVADGGTGASTASAARTNLGLAIGTDVQAYDADLAAIAALSTQTYGRSLLTLASSADLRNDIDAAPYVASVAALQALDTTKDTVAFLLAAGQRGIFVWTAGNFSASITAADPRYIASSANPTGSSGAWIQSVSVTTGQFFTGSGARVNFFEDRAFFGNAVLHNGTSSVTQADWLTTYEIAKGRAGGSLMYSTIGMSNDSGTQASQTLMVGAKTDNLLTGYNGIAYRGLAKNNSAASGVSAYAGYLEAYLDSGSLGGAYALELDTMNFNAEANIDPFTQVSGQTIGLQLAAGGELSATGQFDISAAINIRNNHTAYRKAIVIGNDAISGTNGTDGGIGQAVVLATGHAIDYYYSAGNTSWRLSAAIGVNGDYNITSFGAGSVAVPSLKVNGNKLSATAGTATVTVPNSTTTLVGHDTTNTLTNKTINATNNTVSNLTTAMFATNVVDTDGTFAANSDTRLASQKAVKTYVDGSAYTSYTPTISAGAGTITTSSATGRHREIGKTVFVEIVVTITTNGTGATNVTATLPNAAAAFPYIIAGRENAVGGKMLQGYIAGSSSQVIITNYDNTYPGANGTQFILSGSYERA